jgi:hypothetical protein
MTKTMSESDILSLISADPWMMHIIDLAAKTAAEHNLPDWMIGAGFVRNKVWDHIHGYDSAAGDDFSSIPVHLRPSRRCYDSDHVPTSDIDLIYFDPARADASAEAADEALSREMTEKTGIPWEIVNQSYTHAWHNRGPYASATDALADWVETATCIAVSRDACGALRLHAPHGVSDLVHGRIRKNERCSDAASFALRVSRKRWLEIWPRLEVVR